MEPKNSGLIFRSLLLIFLCIPFIAFPLLIYAGFFSVSGPVASQKDNFVRQDGSQVLNSDATAAPKMNTKALKNRGNPAEMRRKLLDNLVFDTVKPRYNESVGT